MNDTGAAADDTGSAARDMDLLEALVRIPSPTGQEAEAVAFLQDQARADGMAVHRDRAGNFIAEAGRGDRLLLMVGHIDTVPGHIPVRIEDGELWGRGAVDAKGPLAAFYLAARAHRDHPELRIMVVGAVDEEGRSVGVKALPPDLDPEWIVVGEPSGSHAMTFGYKGILRVEFDLACDVVHGAHPEPGAADQVVTWWHDLRQQLEAGDGFHDVQLRLDSVRTQDDGLRDHAKGSFQVRIPPATTPEAIETRITEHSARHHVRVHVHERMPAVQADPRSPLAACFRAAIRQAGGRPVGKLKTGTADMNHLAGWHPGVPILAYGPGDPALDHRPDERVPLEEFQAGVAVLTDVVGMLPATTQKQAVPVGAT